MTFSRCINALALAVAWLLVSLPASAAASATAADSPQLLQKKCDAKDWEACYWLAYAYKQGEGVVSDAAKAGAIYDRACTAGHANSCVSLSFMWDDGALGNDLPKVLRLLDRACELEDGEGCYYLGQYYLSGRGVAQDVTRAVKLYELGCDLEAGDACIELQGMLEKGDVIPKDKKRADAYYERGCDLAATLCVMALNGYMNPLEENCDKGGFAACAELGHMHLRGESYLKVDEAEASKYFQKACDGNLAEACATLGWVLDYGKQVPKNPSKAVALYQKACTGKYAYGCQMLGFHYLSGDGVVKDERRAAALLHTACSANTSQVVLACWMLGDMYDHGTGVAKDAARAVLFNAQACRLGEKDACAAPVAAKPASMGCSVVKVQLGTDTFASVKSDITRRGGNASGGTNNGKPVLNAIGQRDDRHPCELQCRVRAAASRSPGRVGRRGQGGRRDMRDAAGVQRGHLVRLRVLRTQNFALNCTPKICGSFRKPVRLLKSMPPVATSSSVMLRPKSAASYLPPSQL
jgi:TPR repeat protein